MFWISNRHLSWHFCLVWIKVKIITLISYSRSTRCLVQSKYLPLIFDLRNANCARFNLLHRLRCIHTFAFTFKTTFIFAFAVRMTLITGLETGCLDSAQGLVQLLPFCLPVRRCRNSSGNEQTLSFNEFFNEFYILRSETHHGVQSKTSIHYMQLCSQLNCKFGITSWGYYNSQCCQVYGPQQGWDTPPSSRCVCVCLQLELRFINAIYSCAF